MIRELGRGRAHEAPFGTVAAAPPGAVREVTGLTDELKRFYVWGGSAWFLVRELQPVESFGVDTSSAAVTLERAGTYRIDVSREGDTRVAVDRGSACVTAAGVAVPLRSGDVVNIDGLQRPVHEAAALRLPCSGMSDAENLPGRARDQVLPFRPRPSH